MTVLPANFLQFFPLTVPDAGFLDLSDLVGQEIHLPTAELLVNIIRCQLLLLLPVLPVKIGNLLPQSGILTGRELIQDLQMLLLMQQRLVLMLPVNIQKEAP